MVLNIFAIYPNNADLGKVENTFKYTKMNANKKGKRFELKVAKYLAEKLQANIRRTPNSGGLSLKGDLLCIDDNSILSEFNQNARTKKLNIWKALEQSRNDCLGNANFSSVFHKNFERDYVAIELDDFVNLLIEVEEARTK